MYTSKTDPAFTSSSPGIPDHPNATTGTPPSTSGASSTASRSTSASAAPSTAAPATTGAEARCRTPPPPAERHEPGRCSDSGEVAMPRDMRTREGVPCPVYVVAERATHKVTEEICALVKMRAPKLAVIAVTASSSFVTPVLEELVQAHKKGSISFSNVVIFSFCEYYPMESNSLQSCQRLLREIFLDHVDVQKENVFFLDGSLPQSSIDGHTKQYEDTIARYGGIDLALIGLDGAGRIGLNEIGASVKTRTRLVYLDNKLRHGLAAHFFGFKNVPSQAITMGISSVARAKRVIAIAFSEGSASVVAKTVENVPSEGFAAAVLKSHPNTVLYVDLAAAAELTCFKCPWVITQTNSLVQINYTAEMICKAVVWLSLKIKKPILKLEDDDYRENSLTQLVDTHGPAHMLNLQVYRKLQNALTGWPGGRSSNPHSSFTGPQQHPTLTNELTNYDTAHVPRKRVIVFSPHPDDDVISMGGTLIRLCDQGHEVHTVYQTSGNIAVWDDDALRYASFVVDYTTTFGMPEEQVASAKAMLEALTQHVVSKSASTGWLDSPELLSVKGLIRRNEAIAAALYAGVLKQNIHFLDLPFYKTGTIKKNPITDQDVKIVKDLLEQVKPHQIFAAGDLSDPHGTHRMCLKSVLLAIDAVKDSDWFQNCQVWLYRGAWQEWEPENIDMAVPMSPKELFHKRLCIFKHQSQKDIPPFAGSDPREFWQRSEARNRSTAALFDSLGLSEYEAIESFKVYDPKAPSGFF
ncbi:glucosamine-6-phosphate isomerase [Pelomyxa schiedti]|nr:glucosamine-6-phosphate isomerase [Pelomyxa schiedti]